MPKDPDMGNSHSKSTALGLTKLLAKALELLRTGHNSAHRADVLSESRKVPQPARCRSENNAC